MADYVNPRAQACQNCVRAKAKCYGRANGKCERCGRLAKDCISQAPVVRKRKSVKTTQQAQASRIAELEERLNGLVSVLAGPNAAQLSHLALSLASTSTSASNSGHNNVHQVLEAPEVSANIPRVNSTPPIYDNLLNLTPPAIQSIVPTDPDELLQIYRTKIAHQVPFVLVPANKTAEVLAIEKPFIYQAIIAVSSYHDSVRQIDLYQDFLRTYTDHVVMRGEKSLDMLQGMLIIISRYNGMFYARSQLTTLLGLAFALVVNLHLTFPRTSFENHEKFLNEMKGIVSCNHATWSHQVDLCREEERTMLGCYYVFSCVSTLFCRVNPIHWTPHIQHCYENILNSPEAESDVLLAHLSNLQRIPEDIRNGGIRDSLGPSKSKISAFGVQFKMLLSQLKACKDSLPSNLQSDPLVLMHYHSIEMYIFELCFSMPPTSPAQTLNHQRRDVMLMCLEATKALVDVYFSVNVEAVPYLLFGPASVYQVYFGMTILSKLSLFDADDWDVTIVSQTLDLSTLLDRIAAMCESVSSLYDLGDDKKPWLQISRIMKQVKIKFESLLANENWPICSLAASSGEQVSLDPFLNQVGMFDYGFWQSFPDDGTFTQ